MDVNPGSLLNHRLRRSDRHRRRVQGPGRLPALISLPPAFISCVRTGGALTSCGLAGVLDRVWESVGGDAGAHGLLEFLSEDKAICERVQCGDGGDFVPGRLVLMERVFDDLDHYLNWRISGSIGRYDGMGCGTAAMAPDCTSGVGCSTAPGTWMLDALHRA